MIMNRIVRLVALLAASATLNGVNSAKTAAACANCDSETVCNLDTFTGFKGCRITLDKCKVDMPTCGVPDPD